MLHSIDIMTHVCPEGTFLGAQHILDPGNTSSWGGHTKVILWAIWVDPKSRAHLATAPSPNTGGFGRRPKGMLDSWDLIPIKGYTPV